MSKSHIQEKTEKLFHKILPELAQPIYLYTCGRNEYETFENQYGEPTVALEPEQTGLPPLLPDIRFVAKRFKTRPIRLGDVLKALFLQMPIIMHSEMASDKLKERRNAKYGEIIELWDFNQDTLFKQTNFAIDTIYRILRYPKRD